MHKAGIHSNITKREQRRDEREHERQLLYDRHAAKRLLGNVSLSTLIRLERAGRLQPRKLAGSAAGKTYYSAADIDAVAGAVAEQELA